MSRHFDPVLTELIQNELSSITEEMAIVIWRTGQSAMMKAGDFATAVCDAQGRVIGQGFAAPMQLAVFDELLKCVCSRFDGHFEHGDVIITNDPYNGMSHMPDIAVVTPVVIEGRIAAFCVAYSHHADVGGRFPGSSSSYCRTSYEEGVRIPLVKFKRGSPTGDAVFDLVCANVRVPDEWRSDMNAKLAGCAKGAEQAAQMVGRYGWDSYTAACDHLVEHAARSMRAAIAATPDGVFEADYVIPDDEGRAGADLHMKLTLRVEGDRIAADFTGTCAQVDRALNCPFSFTKAAVAAALKTLIGPELPMNRGFTESVDVIAPPGSLLNPIFPSAVGGRAVVFYAIYDLVNQALAKAMPADVPAMGEGADLLHFSGTDASGNEFAFIDLFYGGWGARPTKDGIHGVAPVFLGSYGCASAELLEADYPIVVEQFGYVPGTGGAGTYSGSVAVAREWRFLCEGNAMIRSVRLEAPPSLMGGVRGAAPRTMHTHSGREADLGLKTHVHVHVQPGDRLYHSTAGAGGFGSPHARDVQDVARDVRAGLLDREQALRLHGVCITDAGDVDPAATDRVRKELA